MENLEQSDNTEFLNGEAPNNGQAEQAVNTVKEEDYKSLQAEYTRANQAKIDLSIKLANLYKNSILEISDKRLQDKVIKEIYWLNNIEEVKLIHWDSFYAERTTDEEDEDKFSTLEKKVKLMEYNASKGQLEKAIEDYKKENKIMFELEWTEDKIREELKYISTEISAEERVKRAWKIIFGVTTNPTDNAYLKLIQTQPGYVAWDTSFNKEEKTKIQDEFSSIFRRK